MKLLSAVLFKNQTMKRCDCDDWCSRMAISFWLWVRDSNSVSSPLQLRLAPQSQMMRTVDKWRRVVALSAFWAAVALRCSRIGLMWLATIAPIKANGGSFDSEPSTWQPLEIRKNLFDIAMDGVVRGLRITQTFEARVLVVLGWTDRKDNFGRFWWLLMVERVARSLVKSRLELPGRSTMSNVSASVSKIILRSKKDIV